MDLERIKELECSEHAVLTKDEWEEGWHFCYDWDGMLVNKNDKEGEGRCCTCNLGPYPGDKE